MKQELHSYLDGELAVEDLPEELRSEARAWDALLADVRATTAARAPKWLESKILRSLEEPASSSVWVRFASWWLRPRLIPVPPAAGLIAAVGLVWVLRVGLLGGLPGQRDVREAAGGIGTPSAERIYVQFMFRAPGASSVAVAGDFSGWTPEAVLEDPDGDGVWSGRIALEPGVHEYMFVIDGKRWVTDPNAKRYAEDGFGNRNAVLAITPATQQGL
ncbi:MAG: glycogen-binding domain-containing protein [Gemmatimonadota bacterium]